MADPQTDPATPGGAQARARETEPGRGKNGDRGVPAESRSFDPAVTGWRASDLIAGEPGGSGLLEPFLTAHLEMNRWFDDMWRQVTGMGAPTLRTARPFAGFGASALFGLPPSDLRESEKAYHLSVELPGLTREDVDLKVKGDALSVCGHKAEETSDTGAAYRFSERRFGRFERTFPIPPDVDRDRISADFRDGVLKVDLPRSAEAQPRVRKIDIR